MIRDYLGNALEPGAYIVYSALSNKKVVMRLARVVSSDGGLKVSAAEFAYGRRPDGTYGRAWFPLRGHPTPNQAVRIPHSDVPAEVREFLGGVE